MAEARGERETSVCWDEKWARLGRSWCGRWAPRRGTYLGKQRTSAWSCSPGDLWSFSAAEHQDQVCIWGQQLWLSQGERPRGTQTRGGRPEWRLVRWLVRGCWALISSGMGGRVPKEAHTLGVPEVELMEGQRWESRDG